MERTIRRGTVGTRKAAALAGTALALFSAACAASGSSRNEIDSSASGPWVEPSPLLRQRIEDEAARLPWTHGFERLEQIRWFAAVGEPGYAQLLELAEDPRDGVAGAALAAIGMTTDRRLVPHVHALQWSAEREESDVGLERARTLVRLGDWGAMPRLIEGLRDERLYTRSLCLEALEEATHETFGYEPRAEESEREAAARRWEQWWDRRAADALLAQPRS